MMPADEKCILDLAKVIADKKAPASARVAAACALLDRAYGHPVEIVKFGDKEEL